MDVIYNLLKYLVKSLLLPFYWIYRNLFDGLHIYNLHLSPKVKLGRGAMIRSNTEIGDISLGSYSYISGPHSYVESAQIGKYCSIARQVVIGASGHNYNWVTTSPVIVTKTYGMISNNVEQPQKHAPIIGNDVWVGINAVIMRGVTIGDGAVIAAGSVVTTNVAPYSIVGGIPAKHIKFRFNEHQVEQLLKIGWWNWNVKKVKENSHLFYDIDQFISVHKITQ
jgi:acetyltransferase-like isoleucine patch superfamily enzyme